MEGIWADQRRGQRVLVHAAAGGVGHVTVQIAKLLGAEVIGTASGAKHAFVKGLGADQVIDYTVEDFTAAVRDFDAVIDTIGAEYGPRSLRVLKPGGLVVSLTSPAEAALDGPALAAGKRAAFMSLDHGVPRRSRGAAGSAREPIWCPPDVAADGMRLVGTRHDVGPPPAVTP